MEDYIILKIKSDRSVSLIKKISFNLVLLDLVYYSHIK